MLWLLLVLFTSVLSQLSWISISNGETLTNQDGPYFSFISSSFTSLRFAKITVNSTTPLDSYLSVCAPFVAGNPPSALGPLWTCVNQVSCNLFLPLCTFQPNTSYFITVTGADFTISVTEIEPNVTTLQTDGSQAIDFQLTRFSIYDNSFRIFNFTVSNTSTMNAVFLRDAGFDYVASQASTFRGLCDEPRNFITERAFSSNGFTIGLQNDQSCPSLLPSGPRFIFVHAATNDQIPTGRNRIFVEVKNETLVGLLPNATNDVIWPNTSRPIGFFFWDFPADSFGNIIFENPFSNDQCTIFGSRNNNPAVATGDTRMCLDDTNNKFFLTSDALFTPIQHFGPCHVGRWFITVFCSELRSITAAETFSYSIMTSIIPLTDPLYDVLPLDYGTNSTVFNGEVLLQVRDTASITLPPGPARSMVTMHYFETGNAPLGQISVNFARGIPSRWPDPCVDIGGDPFEIGGFITEEPYFCRGPAKDCFVSWWPCRAATGLNTTNDDVFVFIDTLGATSFQVNVSLSTPAVLPENSVVNVNNPGASFIAFAPVFPTNSSELVLLRCSDPSLQVALFNPLTCTSANDTLITSNNTIVSFCSEDRSDYVFHISNISSFSQHNPLTVFTVASSTFPAGSALNQLWNDTSISFQGRLVDEALMVQFDLTTLSPWSLQFSVNSTSGVLAPLSIRIFRDCDFLGFNEWITNQSSVFHYRNISALFTGRIRIAILNVRPGTQTTFNITLSTGINTCKNVSIASAPFCFAMLNSTGFFTHLGFETLQLADEAASSAFTNLSLLFNGTLDSNCSTLLMTFTCSLYFTQCQPSGIPLLPCHQCDLLTTTCGLSSTCLTSLCSDTSLFCGSCGSSECSPIPPPPAPVPGVPLTPSTPLPPVSPPEVIPPVAEPVTPPTVSGSSGSFLPSLVIVGLMLLASF